MALFQTGALLAIVALVLHFVWESSHVSLYVGYEHWSLGLPIYLLATLGDVLYTLGAFALVCALKKTDDWIHDVRMSDYLTLVAIGFFIALFVEYKGLALERWQYLPDMPIVPILNVGLSPLLEMALLLPLTVFLTSYVLQYLTRHA